MLLWFIGTSVLTVWFVFGDPRFDYRPLIVGSVVPTAVDVWFGGRWLLHTLLASVGVLALAMLVSIGRRARRRVLIGFALGILLHLVFTGAWLHTDTFWWPFSGAQLGSTPLPESERGWWNLVFEALGLAMVAWVVVRARLAESGPRREFIRSGHLGLPVRR